MDPESKLFYRKLLDFGPGVGFREGQRKFEEEHERAKAELGSSQQKYDAAKDALEASEAGVVAEADGGLSQADAERFVAEALEPFRLPSTAVA